MSTEAQNSSSASMTQNCLLADVDYSYGGIVNRVQNDAQKGIEELKSAVENIWIVDNEIQRLERKLKEAQGYKAHYQTGIENLRQHLKLKYPIGILMNGVAVEIDEQKQIKVVQLVNVG